MSTIPEIIRSVQTKYGLRVDGQAGMETWARIARELKIDQEAQPSHTVLASSFADPADVRAFKACKAEGKTDQQCFKVGDNGIGFTGLNCATEDVCLCALPREDWLEKWGTAAAASGKPVIVTHNGREVSGALGDTMPNRANIHNGCGIDLNPGFAKALDLKPPFKTEVTWRWA